MEKWLWFFGFAALVAFFASIGFFIWDYEKDRLEARVELCEQAIEVGKEVLCKNDLVN
jgi:hypothetical protein